MWRYNIRMISAKCNLCGNVSHLVAYLDQETHVGIGRGGEGGGGGSFVKCDGERKRGRARHCAGDGSLCTGGRVCDGPDMVQVMGAYV